MRKSVFIFPDKLSERTHVSWPHAWVVGIMGGFSSGLMAEVHGKTADAKCAAAPETKVQKLRCPGDGLLGSKVNGSVGCFTLIYPMKW